MANPVRIRILEELRAAESLPVGEIQQRVGIEASNVSQHLGIMRGRGIVGTRREGTSVWYFIAEPAIGELLDTARNIFERQLEAQTAMLKAE